MWEQEPKHKSSHAKGQFLFLKVQVEPCGCLSAAGPQPHRELRMLCEASDVQTSQRAQGEPAQNRSISSAPWHRCHFPIEEGHQPLLLSQCFCPTAKDPSWQEGDGIVNLGCELQNSSFLNLDHGLCFRAEGKMQTFCCSSYYIQLSGPFFNYHDTNEGSGVSSSLSKYFRETLYSS